MDSRPLFSFLRKKAFPKTLMMTADSEEQDTKEKKMGKQRRKDDKKEHYFSFQNNKIFVRGKGVEIVRY
jgi:hypothetical protein